MFIIIIIIIIIRVRASGPREGGLSIGQHVGLNMCIIVSITLNPVVTYDPLSLDSLGSL